MTRALPIPLLNALSCAEDALSRADEALSERLAEGVQARLAYHDASSLAWNQGELVHLEDLVLRDEDLDVRMPDPALLLAERQLRAGRVQLPANVPAFSLAGVRALLPRRAGDAVAAAGGTPTTGQSPDANDPRASARPREGAGELDAVFAAAAAIKTDEDQTALQAWISLCRGLDPAWPALLRAACVLELWSVLDPLPRYSFVGPLLAAWDLRRGGRLRGHRPWIALGQRRVAAQVGPRRTREDSIQRVSYWLGVLASSGEAASEEVRRLRLVRQVLALKLVGRRSNSRLAALVELLIDRPVVTAGLIAQRLRISQKAARDLIGELGASVVEITGRTRYRAWRV